MIERSQGRTAVALAIAVILTGCAAPSDWRTLMQPDEDIGRLDNKDSFLETVTNPIKETERLTLLPQTDGRKSSLVVTGAGQPGEVVLSEPYAEAAVTPDAIKKGAVRPQAINSRYVDTITALPITNFQSMVRKTVLGNPEVQALGMT